MIEAGWGDNPVHPSGETYAKIASAIISQEWQNVEPQVDVLPGLGLLADVPEWQKPQAALSFKRNNTSHRFGPSKFQRRY
jgi:hypothetical protein